MAIKLKFDISNLDGIGVQFMRELEVAIPMALMDAMDYFGLVTTPMVPIDTGALRESFEVYLEGSRTVVGKWETLRGDFPYGTYQYYNHATMSHWTDKAWEIYGENVRLVFEDTIQGAMRRWTN